MIKPLIKSFCYSLWVIIMTGCNTLNFEDMDPMTSGIRHQVQVLKFKGTITTTHKQWFLPDNPGTYLVNFNKNDFPGADSIVFAPVLRTLKTSNYCYAELYNVTDQVSIAGSQVESNGRGWYEVRSENIMYQLPDKPITLGIRIRSESDGVTVATSTQNFLYVISK